MNERAGFGLWHVGCLLHGEISSEQSEEYEYDSDRVRRSAKNGATPSKQDERAAILSRYLPYSTG